MKTLRQILPTLFLLWFFTLLFFVFYGGIFKGVSSFSALASGDAAKNVYVVDYHVHHGTSWIWFEGMNYPFGELVTYTDNQPLFTSIIRIFSFVIPADTPMISILFLLTFISFLAGAWFIFDIIRAEGNTWVAAVISIGIMLLSPQFLRLTGHFSLTYGGIIPCYFWLLNKFDGSRKFGWISAIWMLITGFIHPYFLAMLSMFALIYFIFKAISDGRVTSVRSWIDSLLFSLGPLIAFQLINWMLDPVNDRPLVPFGFLFYRATLGSIFLPLNLEYAQDWFDFDQSQEGSFYVGLFAIVALIWMILSWFRNRKITLEFTNLVWLAAIPIFLLAIAFPFYIWKFDRLLNYTGPLQQFRGIGRFSFIFFYAINITAGNWLVKKFNRNILSKYITFLLIGLLLFEGFQWSQHVRKRAACALNSTLDNLIGDVSAIDFEKYQAILPLPFFHIGSENFRTENTNSAVENCAFELSMHTGIPMLAVNLSRTSLHQTLQSLELVGEIYKTPDIINEMHSDKPLLLLVRHGWSSNALSQLLAHSFMLMNGKGFNLYELPVHAFEQISNENKLIATKGHATHTDNLQNKCYYQDFDKTSSQLAFDGIGAMSFDRNDWTRITPDSFVFEDSVNYELSFWFYAGKQHSANTQVWFWERNGEEEVQFFVKEVGDYVAAVNGDWMLARVPISVNQRENSVEIMLHRDGQAMNLWLDELLLKPTDLNVSKPGSVNMNNLFFNLQPSNLKE